MTEFLASAWWLVVSLGILVTIHEFGHFWVARRCGVRVLRFSIGFGRALWRRLGADGTEYRVAAIPLGGYVKMLDEREYEVPEADAGQAFNRQPVWKRIAIVAAGPAANLLLCFLLLWAMFVWAAPTTRRRWGRRPGSPPSRACATATGWTRWTGVRPPLGWNCRWPCCRPRSTAPTCRCA